MNKITKLFEKYLLNPIVERPNSFPSFISILLKRLLILTGIWFFLFYFFIFDMDGFLKCNLNIARRSCYFSKISEAFLECLIISIIIAIVMVTLSFIRDLIIFLKDIKKRKRGKEFFK